MKVNFRNVYMIVSGLAIIILFIMLKQDNMNSDVIRTKGIVIVDDNGKERILIGAPIPYAKNRIRTDSVRAKESWGYIHPDYMKFYQKYEHSTNGILILDENGYDRIALGNDVPDPNIGKRIAPSSGIAINDEEGYERTGYGLLKVNGLNRVNLGMDTNKGTEGLVLTVDDDGTTGLTIRSQKENIFLGTADSVNWFTRDRFPFNGLLIENSDSTKFILNGHNK